MALSFTTTDGTLVIPGAYSTIKVRADSGGLATTGVVVLMGEAEQGPKWDLEDDLEENAFGPDQVGTVTAKYGSGRLVDAFRLAAQPSADTQIIGSPAAIILVKTNSSTKASTALTDHASAAWRTLADKGYGKTGNLIKASVTASAAESLPTTGSFTFIPAVGTVNLEIRKNGGAALAVSLSAADTPADFVSDVNALAGVSATGGTDRVAHPTSGDIAISVSGNNVTVTTTATWQVTPSVGDTMVIGEDSVISGAGDENVGAYVVTAATSSTISATKLSDAGDDDAVVGVLTAPVAVLAVGVGGSPENNLVIFAPVVITQEAADPINGVGKTLEIAELTTGTDLLSRCCFELGTTNEVDWVSTAALPAVLTSEAEYAATLNASRQSDGLTDEISAGGEVALLVSYDGTTATMTIDKSADSLTTTVAGGSGTSLSLTLSDFTTLADLAEFIDTQAGYSAEVSLATLGQLAPTVLDDVSAMGICSVHGAHTGRVKTDAYRMFEAVSQNAVLVQLQDGTTEEVEAAASGLPAPMAAVFLSGGTKGSTSGTDFGAALDALELVSCNFIVPLLSRDASEDIADVQTDSASDYEVDGVNALVKTHVLKMATLKRKGNRQAFLSKRGAFSAVKRAAANLATPRCSLAFQDVKVVNSAGTITQYQPWMLATCAAAMQAAGNYRALVGKYLNGSGVVQAAGDFDDRSIAQSEEALKAGLLFAKRERTGGFTWVSDQTTYSRDDNFVFNSIQAIYAADIVALTTAQRMELAYKGASLADVSAGAAKATLDVIMQDMMRLKFIAPSSDAPKGYKNASVKISGPVMSVSLEIKLAGALYFIPIAFTVSQVTQSA